MQRSNRRESDTQSGEAVGCQRSHEALQKVQDIGWRQDYRNLLSTKALGMFVQLKDVGALQNELKNDYIITKELSALSGGLALRCGRLLAVANTLLITAKHVDFSGEQHPSCDADGYPLAGVDEVPTAKQSTVTDE